MNSKKKKNWGAESLFKPMCNQPLVNKVSVTTRTGNLYSGLGHASARLRATGSAALAGTIAGGDRRGGAVVVME